MELPKTQLLTACCFATPILQQFGELNVELKFSFTAADGDSNNNNENFRFTFTSPITNMPKFHF